MLAKTVEFSLALHKSYKNLLMKLSFAFKIVAGHRNRLGIIVKAQLKQTP
jgi:hypothetical protein